MASSQQGAPGRKVGPDISSGAGTTDFFTPFYPGESPFNSGNWIAGMQYMGSAKQKQLMFQAYKNSGVQIAPQEAMEIYDYYFKTGEYLEDPSSSITETTSKQLIESLMDSVDSAETDQDEYI